MSYEGSKILMLEKYWKDFICKICRVLDHYHVAFTVPGNDVRIRITLGTIRIVVVVLSRKKGVTSRILNVFFKKLGMPTSSALLFSSSLSFKVDTFIFRKSSALKSMFS